MKDPDLQLIAERYAAMRKHDTPSIVAKEGVIGPGAALTVGEFGAGHMQKRAMDKAVKAGEISAQDAQAELAASAKPKSKGKTKLIKSSSKPKKEATDINNMGEVYMEQMFNPSQVANELVAYAVSGQAPLEWVIANVPSIQNHPQVVQFAQQLQGQVPAPAV